MLFSRRDVSFPEWNVAKIGASKKSLHPILKKGDDSSTKLAWKRAKKSKWPKLPLSRRRFPIFIYRLPSSFVSIGNEKKCMSEQQISWKRIAALKLQNVDRRKKKFHVFFPLHTFFSTLLSSTFAWLSVDSCATPINLFFRSCIHTLMKLS